MESQPQNPEFRTNPENFHPCIKNINKNHHIQHNKHTYFLWAHWYFMGCLSSIFFIFNMDSFDG